MLIKNVMPRKLRGFTLTEAAIVLGIVGLILGAIWVAAAAVYNNLRVGTTSNQLLSMVQNIRSMHATQQTVDPALTELAIARAGGIPSDMIDSPQNPGSINPAQPISDVWAGGVDIIPFNGGVPNDSFVIGFDLVPRGACADLIVRSTGAGRDTGLLGVSVGGAGAPGAPAAAVGVNNPGMFPIGVATATGMCNAATNSVSFTFRLRG